MVMPADLFQIASSLFSKHLRLVHRAHVPQVNDFLATGVINRDALVGLTKVVYRRRQQPDIAPLWDWIAGNYKEICV